MNLIGRRNTESIDFIHELHSKVSKLTESEKIALTCIYNGELPPAHVKEVGQKWSGGICEVIVGRKTSSRSGQTPKLAIPTAGEIPLFKLFRPEETYDGGFWFKPYLSGERAYLAKTVLCANLLLESYENLVAYGDTYENIYNGTFQLFKSCLETLERLYEDRTGLDAFVYENKSDDLVSIDSLLPEETGDRFTEVINAYNYMLIPGKGIEREVDKIKQVAKKLDIDVQEVREVMEYYRRTGNPTSEEVDEMISVYNNSLSVGDHERTIEYVSKTLNRSRYHIRNIIDEKCEFYNTPSIEGKLIKLK